MGVDLTRAVTVVKIGYATAAAVPKKAGPTSGSSKLTSPGGTHLATFRAVAKKYPRKAKSEVLADLVASMPGNEGKWFAAAGNVGPYDEPLASRAPCEPKTLTRAARAPDLRGRDQTRQRARSPANDWSH